MSKIVLDNKRPASFGSDFNPGDAFDREIDGDVVTFRRLRPSEPPLVRARRIKGRWVGATFKPSREAILAAIGQDREARSQIIGILPR